MLLRIYYSANTIRKTITYKNKKYTAKFIELDKFSDKIGISYITGYTLFYEKIDNYLSLNYLFKYNAQGISYHKRYRFFLNDRRRCY